MVREPLEAVMDARTGDHWANLADSLPGHHRQFRLCVRASSSTKSAVAGGAAVRHQPRGECDLHADPVRDAEPAAGCRGHNHRVGDDHLDDVGRLEAL